MLWKLLAWFLDAIAVKYIESESTTDEVSDAVQDFIDYIYCECR